MTMASKGFSSLCNASTDLQTANHSQWKGLSADRRARLLQAEDDTEPFPELIKPSRVSSRSKQEAREQAPSPDGPAPYASAKERAEHLAEQGWIEKRGNGKGRSWSIRRMDAESAPKKAKPPTEEPKLRQPAPMKRNAAAGFLDTYSGRDPSHAREHYGQARINGIPVEEYSEVMLALAAKNRKDRDFQDRFAAILASHDGKRVSAEGGTLDADGGCYDADTSYVSESGGGYGTPRDEIMGGAGQSSNYATRDSANERAGYRERRRPAASDYFSGSSNEDVDTNRFEAAPRREPGFRQAYQIREEKMAKLRAEIAEYRVCLKICCA